MRRGSSAVAEYGEPSIGPVDSGEQVLVADHKESRNARNRSRRWRLREEVEANGVEIVCKCRRNVVAGHSARVASAVAKRNEAGAHNLSLRSPTRSFAKASVATLGERCPESEWVDVRRVEWSGG